MANTKVQSEQIEDGSITADKLADGTIVAAELADNAVVTAAINADAVTGAKIADNAIDSEHYTDGSIDTAHIADAQITVGKMAANSVDSDQYVDGSIDTVHIADAQVTTAKITDGNISTAKIADNAVTSAKIDTNIDIAGTFDVTGATTLDAGLTVGAGTVLIGADSGDSFNSDSMLRLQRTGDRVFMQFKTDADQNSGILFGDVDDDVECAIEYEPANKALTFSTGNNAERIRITNTGLIGMGDSPSNLTDEIVTITTPSSGGGQGLAFKRLDSNSDQVVGTLRYSNNSTDNLAKIIGKTDGANTSSRLTLQTNTGSGLVDTIVARSNGYVDFTGAADLRVTFGSTGTAGNNDANWVRGEGSSLAFNAASTAHKWEVGGAPVARLDADGLRFGSDTATANGLDDYEEGIFEANLVDSGGGATYTQSSSYNQLSYTKVGRLVTIHGTLVVSGVSGTANGTIQISNLPFTSANLTDQSGKSGGCGVSIYQVQKYSSGAFPATSLAEGSTTVQVVLGVVDANTYACYANTATQLYWDFTYVAA